MLALGLAISATAYYRSTLNPRLLHGEELSYATECYREIREADANAEWNPTIRAGSVQRAEVALAKLEGYAHTKEAAHAKRVLRYYLESVKELPRMDEQCTVLRLPWGPSGTAQATMEQTVPFLKCLSARSAVERNIRACRNEAQSYLELGHQPPVDTCIYNFETPVVERR
jgi:hypothetical protein